MTDRPSTGAPIEAILVVAIFVTAIFLLFMGVLLFWPAGRLSWARGWWFLAVLFVCLVVEMAYLWRVNPEIYAARQSIIGQGTKAWDLALMPFLLVLFLAIFFVAALDDGRHHWLPMPDWVVWLGYVLVAAGFWLTGWAQAVNRHFEPSVRIQTDGRRHGPYAIIRHPGYAGRIPLVAGFALGLGSVWPSSRRRCSVLCSPTGVREEQSCAELPGYAICPGVKYRWIRASGEPVRACNATFMHRCVAYPSAIWASRLGASARGVVQEDDRLDLVVSVFETGTDRALGRGDGSGSAGRASSRSPRAASSPRRARAAFGGAPTGSPADRSSGSLARRPGRAAPRPRCRASGRTRAGEAAGRRGARRAPAGPRAPGGPRSRRSGTRRRVDRVGRVEEAELAGLAAERETLELHDGAEAALRNRALEEVGVGRKRLERVHPSPRPDQAPEEERVVPDVRSGIDDRLPGLDGPPDERARIALVVALGDRLPDADVLQVEEVRRPPGSSFTTTQDSSKPRNSGLAARNSGEWRIVARSARHDPSVAILSSITRSLSGSRSRRRR